MSPSPSRARHLLVWTTGLSVNDTRAIDGFLFGVALAFGL